MKSLIVGKIIVGLARMLECSPLTAHTVIMTSVFIAYMLLSPPPITASLEFRLTFLGSFIGISALVILITWALNGKDWAKSEPWQKKDPP